MKHPVSDDIIISAFRYCLGRRTYTVSDFVHEVIPIIPYLSINTKNIMLNNLCDCKDFGMETDKAEWNRFKIALEKN